MRKLYKKAYSIIRYIQNDVQWDTMHRVAHHYEYDLVQMPDKIVGAAFRSWVAQAYKLPDIPNVYLDIQTARKFRETHGIAEVKD